MDTSTQCEELLTSIKEVKEGLSDFIKPFL